MGAAMSAGTGALPTAALKSWAMAAFARKSAAARVSATDAKQRAERHGIAVLMMAILQYERSASIGWDDYGVRAVSGQMETQRSQVDQRKRGTSGTCATGTKRKTIYSANLPTKELRLSESVQVTPRELP